MFLSYFICGFCYTNISNHLIFAAEQGLPIEAPPTTALDTQSELNLDSTSLREAAFQKWIAKKKENKTFKKSDLVTVIHDKEDMPSAEEIRQVYVFFIT